MCKYEPLGLAICEVAKKLGIFLSGVLGSFKYTVSKICSGAYLSKKKNCSGV